MLRFLCFAPLLSLTLGAGPGYSGCGDGPSVSPTGSPLPVGELECAEDADCGDGCADVRCIAGECLEVAPLIDADGDGDPPPPCGGDCDDTRPDVGEGFVEACDGLDNDCDGLVDDGARRIDRTYRLPTGDPTTVVVPWGDRFLITNLARGAVLGMTVSLGGETGRPLEIMRLARGGAFTAVAGSAATDGRVLFVTLTDTSLLRYVVARPDGDGIEVVAGPADLMVGLVDVTAIDIIPFEGDWAIGVEGDTPGTRQRVVLTSLDGPPVVRLDSAAPSASFALASDGMHLVLSDAEDGVHFYLPSGAEVTAFTLPGISRARHPLASWRGAVVAVVTDFDTVGIGFVDSVVGLGFVEPAPYGDSVSGTFVHTTSDLVFVSRLSDFQMSVQAIFGDLSTYDGPAITLGNSAAGTPPQNVSVAESRVAIGVAAGNDAMRATLGVIRGCATAPP